MIYSKRCKLARAVERRTREDEKRLNSTGVKDLTIVRDAANTISVLDAMGWLREKPVRKNRKT